MATKVYNGRHKGMMVMDMVHIETSNYLKKHFVLENIITGEKVIVRTWRQYVSLAGDRAEAARQFLNGVSCGQGDWVARPQASFELIS